MHSLGDCCGISDYSRCTFCLCAHDQQALEAEQFSLGYFHNDSCPRSFQHAKGDGFCHDKLNNKDCLYDDGDCCKSTVLINHCDECKCYQTNGGDESAEKLLLKVEPCHEDLEELSLGTIQMIRNAL